MKQIVVHCERGDTHMALLDQGQLIEYALESPKDVKMVGSIYLGRVVNILPGMQAAFVDIGQPKNAFLYIDDLLPANLEMQPKVRPPIDTLLRPDQPIMVQVAKEPVGTKGARVTTHFSLPGRAIVFMPTADYVGISRKIDDEAERARLKSIAESLRRPGEGVIVRTAAEGASEEAMESDLDYLRGLWENIRNRAKGPAPRRLFHDVGTLPRLVRDLFTDDVDELVIDDEGKASEIVSMLAEVAPRLADRVRPYAEEVPILEAYGIPEQLDKSFRPKIWLKSGGYLIFDQTEALTVIDVNTGKFTGRVNLEETVFETNLEAAEQIGRLIRLRDLGGIIIVDFIDMKQEAHRRAITDKLESILQEDRTKALVVGWTNLGLLEMTRKKVRNAKDSLFFTTCSVCGGSGRIYGGRPRKPQD